MDAERVEEMAQCLKDVRAHLVSKVEDISALLERVEAGGNVPYCDDGGPADEGSPLPDGGAMKTYNPYVPSADARDAGRALLNGIEAYVLFDPQGQDAGWLVGAYTAPTVAEAALVIWGRGGRPDIAARGVFEGEDRDCIREAIVAAFEKVADELAVHHGIRLPRDEFYGHFWERCFREAGWRTGRAGR